MKESTGSGIISKEQFYSENESLQSLPNYELNHPGKYLIGQIHEPGKHFFFCFSYDNCEIFKHKNEFQYGVN